MSLDRTYIFVLLAAVSTLYCRDAHAQTSATAETFLQHATNVLPIEARYDYHKSFLSGSIHKPSRNPATMAGPAETALTAEWSVVIPNDSGPLATYGRNDTVEFLDLAMQLKLGDGVSDSTLR